MAKCGECCDEALRAIALKQAVIDQQNKWLAELREQLGRIADAFEPYGLVMGHKEEDIHVAINALGERAEKAEEGSEQANKWAAEARGREKKIIEAHAVTRRALEEARGRVVQAVTNCRELVKHYAKLTDNDYDHPEYSYGMGQRAVGCAYCTKEIERCLEDIAATQPDEDACVEEALKLNKDHFLANPQG